MSAPVAQEALGQLNAVADKNIQAGDWVEDPPLFDEVLLPLPTDQIMQRVGNSSLPKRPG